MHKKDYCEICFETLVKAADGRLYCPVCDADTIGKLYNHYTKKTEKDKKNKEEEKQKLENL